jgi:hypothetical protein
MKALILLVIVWVERVMGIEPTWPAWKAGALPLSYTRSSLVPIVMAAGTMSMPGRDGA